MKALIIIDVQYDFLNGGSLAVPDGNNIIPVINKLQDKFDLIVLTQDWHPENHVSFATTHKANLFTEITLNNGQKQMMWPDHCVQGTTGADIHESLITKKASAIIRKGTNPLIDSYSCFFDNNQQKQTGLDGYLMDHDVTEIYFAGLATDYCVYYSILDAYQLAYNCTLIEDATRPVNKTNYENQIKNDLLNKGIKIIQSTDL